MVADPACIACGDRLYDIYDLLLLYITQDIYVLTI